jgi:hypothetical protein
MAIFHLAASSGLFRPFGYPLFLSLPKRAQILPKSREVQLLLRHTAKYSANPVKKKRDKITVSVDASNKGIGGFKLIGKHPAIPTSQNLSKLSSEDVFSHRVHPPYPNQDHNAIEMIAIHKALKRWRCTLSRTHVSFYCDSISIISALQTGGCSRMYKPMLDSIRQRAKSSDIVLTLLLFVLRVFSLFCSVILYYLF